MTNLLSNLPQQSDLFQMALLLNIYHTLFVIVEQLKSYSAMRFPAENFVKIRLLWLNMLLILV